MPFGQLPVLSESCGGDNFVLAQSKAIERHLARKNGLLGSNERDAAFLDSIGEAWIDLSAKFAEYAYAKDDKKEEAKGNFLEKVWPSFSATHEKFLARNGGNGHYLGSRTTLPDLVTFVTLERIIDAFPEIISENGTPGLWKSFQTIRRDPKIEGYLKSADRMPIRMAKK